MDPTAKDAEDERLAALARYDALDTPAEEAFDRITRIVKNALGVPMASVSLVDGHRQWLKSRQGPLGHEAGKDVAFCAVTIRLDAPLIVEDAATDPRFKDNPLVLGPPHIRAYAGAQLRTRDGFHLGALCAIDTQPRRFAPGQVALLEDLAAMVMEALEAQQLARIDCLTGALTRRAFRDEAERALALATRHHHALSCVAFDLDHFKAINDGHGHAAGDRVLIAAVEACRGRLRTSDIFGRIGGEEFAILLPHTDAAGARKAAEEMRTAIAQASPGGIAMTASFGIATLASPPVPLDELMRRADVALYEAKAAGRNTSVAWRTPADPTVVRRVLKAGQIAFNAGRSVIDCTVRGFGTSGASLDVVSTASIPDTFKLAIAADGFSHACRITAKSDRRIEVAFV